MFSKVWSFSRQDLICLKFFVNFEHIYVETGHVDRFRGPEAQSYH